MEMHVLKIKLEKQFFFFCNVLLNDCCLLLDAPGLYTLCLNKETSSARHIRY